MPDCSHVVTGPGRSPGFRRGSQGLLLLLLAVLPFGCARQPDYPWGSGTIEGRSIVVASQIAAEVRHVAVREGDLVESGAVLVKLDETESELMLRRASLSVSLARNELALLLEGARTEDIRQAQAAVSQAETAAAAARHDFIRAEQLYTAGSLSRRQLDDAEVRRARTAAELESSEQALQRLLRLSRPEELQAARLRIEQAETEEELASMRHGRAWIVAPNAARVDRLLVEPGELARPGAPVARLVTHDPLSLAVYLPQADVARVSVGDRAEVFVDAWPDVRFAGRVTRVAEQAEFTPRNVQTREDRARLVFEVTVELDEDRERRLRPGMAAEAHFTAAGAGPRDEATR